MSKFIVQSEYSPSRDQPKAIKELSDLINVFLFTNKKSKEDFFKVNGIDKKFQLIYVIKIEEWYNGIF